MSAEKITETEFEKWLTPPAALAQVGDTSAAAFAINERVCAGRIRIAAEIVRIHQGIRDDQFEYEIIPSDIWHSPIWHDETFWHYGQAKLEVRQRRAPTKTYSFLGIRFEPSGIQALISASSVAAVAAPSAASTSSGERRGAKRKSWWDDLWIEVLRRIQAGSLYAKNKADLQATLEEIVEHELKGEFGDSTLKPMASKLFDYLEEIRGK